MAKIKINKLPAGFKLDNGKVVEDKFMRDGGDLSTGDQANYGLVTTPQEYYRNTNFNNTDDKDVRYSLSSVPRDNANIEAEGGETVLTDLTNDGVFGLYDIKGPRHSSGGVPMFLPEQSFIYSDTNKMKFNKDELAEFGISTKKKMTPAKLSKKYELNKYYANLESPYADKIQSTTAELMLKKNMMNLSKVAFGQESKKKFEEGVPLAAHPYLVQQGIDPIEFTAKMEEITREQAQMNAIAALPPEKQQELMMLQEMMAQMEQQEQQGQQQPMQQPQQMNQEMAMQEQAMARFGGERRLKQAQRGNETGSEYATRMGQSWPEGVEDPTYDEANEVWVFESGAPSLTKSEAVQMARAAKNGAPVPEVYQVQSTQATTEPAVVDTEIIDEPSTRYGNPGIDPAKWEVWQEKLDAGGHELSTTVDANGRTTVTITETRDAPRVDIERRQASELQGSGSVNITGDDLAEQNRALSENQDYFNDKGLFSDGTRPTLQNSIDSRNTAYGSADIQSEEGRADLRRRWGPQMDQYETDSGNEWDWDMPYEQALAFQKNIAAQRKLDAEAAGITYVPWFIENNADGTPADGGYGFDGMYGLHTFNAPKLTKREYFSDSDSFDNPPSPPEIIPTILPEEISRPNPEYWRQDLRSLAALGQIDDNLYLPWAPDAERIQLAPTFDDWRGAVNANNASASTMANALGAVGGPQAVANSLIQGQAMDANAKAQNRTNTNNVGIANQYGAMQAQYDMAVNAENAKRQTGVYDNTQKVLQAADNFRNWKVNKNADLWNTADTNRADTYNLNTTYDNFAIDPLSGGMINITNPNALNKVGTQPDRSEAWFDNLAEFQRKTPGVEFNKDMWEAYNNEVNGTQNNSSDTNLQREVDRIGGIPRYPTQAAKKGKEIKRMVVPFYTGKMGG